MSNIKQIFYHFYKRLINNKFADVKIHGGSGDRSPRIKNKDHAKKNIDVYIWLFNLGESKVSSGKLIRNIECKCINVEIAEALQKQFALTNLSFLYSLNKESERK